MDHKYLLMLTLNFTPFPILTSERLIFREISESDVNEVFLLRSNPENMKFIPRPLLKNHKDALEHIKIIQNKINKNEGINWVICLKDNPKMIGLLGHYIINPEHYRSEIGYMILPEYHGKGIVTEAVEKLLDYGFNNLKLNSIEAIIDPSNICSERVLQKNNFVKEAHLKENICFEGIFSDSVIYSILKRNYKQ